MDLKKPVDKVAAVVTSKATEHGPEISKGHVISSMVPLPVLKYNGNPKHNLSGAKYGRFTVVGIYAGRPHKLQGTNTGTRWVVRCSCGRYEVRSGKAIRRNKPGSGSMCRECKRFKHLKY